MAMKILNIAPIADKENDREGQYGDYLEVLQFLLDSLKTDIEELGAMNDPWTCNERWLPYLAISLGIDFRNDIAVATQRKIVGNAIRCLKLKGTADALRFMIHKITGFECTVEAEAANMRPLIYNTVMGKFIDPDDDEETDINREGEANDLNVYYWDDMMFDRLLVVTIYPWVDDDEHLELEHIVEFLIRGWTSGTSYTILRSYDEP